MLEHMLKPTGFKSLHSIQYLTHMITYTMRSIYVGMCSNRQGYVYNVT